MVHYVSVLLETYSLMQDAANVTNTAYAFRECLRGVPKAKFNGLLTTPITYKMFKADYQSLT